MPAWASLDGSGLRVTGLPGLVEQGVGKGFQAGRDDPVHQGLHGQRAEGGDECAAGVAAALEQEGPQAEQLGALGGGGGLALLGVNAGEAVNLPPSVR